MTDLGSSLHFLWYSRHLASTGYCIPGLKPKKVTNSGAEGWAGVGVHAGAG